MILRPNAPAAFPLSKDVQPAWPMIEQTENTCEAPYWIVTQPDHAALAGTIAANLGLPLFDPLEPEIVQGIALHDEGWAPFDAPMPSRDEDLVSFFDVAADAAVNAWRGSIACAQGAGPMAGAIVSRHFWRIASMRIGQGKDGACEIEMLQRFLAEEQARQERLVPGQRQEMEAFTDVLQFCDVLSLYLCCGATEDVSFSQQFGGVSPVLRRVQESGEAAVCRFELSPFVRPIDVAVPARRFPDGQAKQFAVLLY
jgi:Protein of unknown function (DUF3891)